MGQATGTYKDLQDSDTAWRLGSGAFTIKGRGFVVGQFVVTAAHVVYPSKLALRQAAEVTTVSQVVAVDQTMIHVGAPAEHGGIPAEIVHINHRFDLAILRPAAPELLQALPYPTAATWWYERPGEVSSVFRTGDCVVAVVPERNTEHTVLPGSQTRPGQVIAPHAVSAQASVVQWLNTNMVTISTLMFPGDSGSPVIAFEAGMPAPWRPAWCHGTRTRQPR
jgi:Trypsin-like peptidase domain